MRNILSRIFGKNSNDMRYEAFKKSISELVKAKDLSDEEIDREYLYIKCILYGIDPRCFNYDVNILEHEIRTIEKRLNKRVINEQIR